MINDWSRNISIPIIFWICNTRQGSLVSHDGGVIIKNGFS